MDRSHRSRLESWFDRILPPVCIVCGDSLSRREKRVCAVCWSRIRRQRHPRCRRCGIALQNIGIEAETSSCIECEAWLPYLREARAPYVMAGVAAALVHALKYGGWDCLADEMGARMAEVQFSRQVERELAAVLAVPLSPTRLRERGFNQADLLAQRVAGQRGLPLLGGVLFRGRHTQRQARLAPRERHANVSGAFRVPAGTRDRLAARHFLLVDDVLTTAATVQDCVRALCSAGARAVSVLTFARARRDLTQG